MSLYLLLLLTALLLSQPCIAAATLIASRIKFGIFSLKDTLSRGSICQPCDELAYCWGCILMLGEGPDPPAT